MRCNRVRCLDRGHGSCEHSSTHHSFEVWKHLGRSYYSVSNKCLCTEGHTCYVGSGYLKGRKNVRCVSEFEYAILKSLDKIKRTRKKYRKHELD